MQQELIEQLIVQFEYSTNRMLTDIKLRRYTIPRIEQRLIDLEESVLLEFGDEVRQCAEPQFESMRRKCLHNVRHVKVETLEDAEIVEDELAYYEQVITKVVQRCRPQLDDQQSTGERDGPGIAKKNTYSSGVWFWLNRALGRR